jgi:hypothetical protein
LGGFADNTDGSMWLSDLRSKKMRKMATAMSAVAVVLFSASLLAQAKPNFSGKWVVDAEKTAAAMPAAMAGGGGGGRGGGRGGGAAGPMTITMDAAVLKMDRTGGDGAVTTTSYKLDGSESKNPGRGGAEQVSKATIEGAKVVIKTMGQNGETVQSWYMEGDFLVNERSFGENVLKTFYKKG